MSRYVLTLFVLSVLSISQAFAAESRQNKTFAIQYDAKASPV